METIPAELRGDQRWILWRYVKRWKKRPGKKPVRPYNHADAKTWSRFESLPLSSGTYDGIGIVLGDGLVGVDVDDCVSPDFTLNEVAQDAMALGSYAEWSPSGQGIKVFIRGTLPDGRRKFKGREIYSGGEGQARWFSVTGKRISSAIVVRNDADGQQLLEAFYKKWFSEAAKPVERGEANASPLTDEEILELLSVARNKKKFNMLFTGIWHGYASQSEADLALCALFRFYTSDAGQIDRLFQRSGLMRPKWREKRGTSTYGELTIQKALTSGGRRYNPDYALQLNAHAQPVPGWYASVLVGCDRTTRRLADLLPWCADAAGYCGRIRNRALAKKLGVSIRSIQRAKNNLERVGILHFDTQDGKDDAFSIALGPSPYRNYVTFGGSGNVEEHQVKRLRASQKPKGVEHAERV